MRKLVIMMIMGVALIALPTMAQNTQEWQSTSTMQGAGSSYTPQVTAVGAVSAHEMATTTTGSSSQSSGPRKAKKEDFGEQNDFGYHDEENSPLGDAVLPLMLCAFAYLGMRVFLRRKRA